MKSNVLVSGSPELLPGRRGGRSRTRRCSSALGYGGTTCQHVQRGGAHLVGDGEGEVATTCVLPSHAQSGQGAQGAWLRICETLGRRVAPQDHHCGDALENALQRLAKVQVQVAALHCCPTIFTTGTTMSSKPDPH